jgi:hypothetical protein
MLRKATIIAVIFLLLLIPSVIAAPKPKEPKPPKTPNNPKTEITFTEKATFDVGTVYLGKQEIIDDILYAQDAITTGTFENGDSPIAGFEIQIIFSGTLDLNSYAGSGNGRWTFIGQSGIISGQFVGHGTESFQNQKIKGIFEGPANSIKAEITIHATITAKN